MKKIVIIINGRGAVGKDTLCGMAENNYRVMNISSITPIKEIAAQCGWSGKKDDKSRKFLSDLKKLMTEFNDYPTIYLLEQYRIFRESEKEILFVQIREGAEIEKFKTLIDIPCFTLLIKRSSQEFEKWGNASDDEVEAYEYDYIFDNCKSLPESELEFIDMIGDMMSAADQ